MAQTSERDSHPLLPAVGGIRLSSCTAGIYRRRRPDLCLIAAAPGTAAVAMFTQNAFAAAPVHVARRHLSLYAPRYLLINAGNANAGTGERGIGDALATCRNLAEIGGCVTEEVLPFSTGVIGEYLPVDTLSSALPALVAGLRDDGWLDCARAIMTTDTRVKGASRRFGCGAATATVTGIAKGAGMIHPRMATMLAFIATDAGASRGILEGMLRDAVGCTFNRISIDGDTSTNDAVVLLATGVSATVRADRDIEQLQDAVTGVCSELAQAIVRDGEGATKFITVQVDEAASSAECDAVAQAIATSPLVKTAFFASDPNWGRILAAIGRAGIVDLDVSRVDVFLDDILVVRGGARAESYTEEQGGAVMRKPEIRIRVRLGRGAVNATSWTCDLSDAYVRINADYRS